MSVNPSEYTQITLVGLGFPHHLEEGAIYLQPDADRYRPPALASG
jgi:hypothetical protein